MVTTTNGTAAPATVQERQPARWFPTETLAQMQAEMERFFGERTPFASWPVFRPLFRLAEPPSAWAPRADVYEYEGAVVVKAELPGVPKEQIEVTVEDGDLVIHGERRAEEKIEEKDFYRMERTFGTFYRRLPLPEGVEAEAIEATFTDGILEVKVPKPASVRLTPTKIAIS
jgi:HSP20 family protein